MALSLFRRALLRPHRTLSFAFHRSQSPARTILSPARQTLSPQLLFARSLCYTTSTPDSSSNYTQKLIQQVSDSILESVLPNTPTAITESSSKVKSFFKRHDDSECASLIVHLLSKTSTEKTCNIIRLSLIPPERFGNVLVCLIREYPDKSLEVENFVSAMYELPKDEELLLTFLTHFLQRLQETRVEAKAMDGTPLPDPCVSTRFLGKILGSCVKEAKIKRPEAASFISKVITQCWYDLLRNEKIEPRPRPFSLASWLRSKLEPDPIQESKPVPQEAQEAVEEGSTVQELAPAPSHLIFVSELAGYALGKLPLERKPMSFAISELVRYLFYEISDKYEERGLTEDDFCLLSAYTALGTGLETGKIRESAYCNELLLRLVEEADMPLKEKLGKLWFEAQYPFSRRSAARLWLEGKNQ